MSSIEYNPEKVTITLKQFNVIKNKFGNTHPLIRFKDDECGKCKTCTCRTEDFLSFLRSMVKN